MKYIYIIGFLFLSVMRVNAQTNDAQAYHDKIINEAKHVGTALSNFNTSLETDSAYLMHSSLAELKRALDTAIAHLDVMPAYKNDDDWHRALLVQFRFYRECVDKEYPKFIDYSLRLAILQEDEISDFTKIITRLNEKEIWIIQLVDEAYKEFVNKYKITPVK